MSGAARKISSKGSDKPEVAVAAGLRASHEIVAALERCKSSSELILDKLPDLLLIMTEDGRILKANIAASELMKSDVEHVINENFFSLFSRENLNSLKMQISVLLKDASLGQLRFELPICHLQSQVKSEFLWTISRFSQVSDRRGQLIEVVGKDVSTIREFERKLTQVFSAIPLGIVTVNGHGKIEWPYSSYCEYLLAKHQLSGKTLQEVLFGPAWGSLDANEQEAASRFTSLLGLDTVSFDKAKAQLPREVQINRRPESLGNPKWLGISYHPLVSEGRVEKIMLILEDRSAVVEAQRATQGKPVGG